MKKKNILSLFTFLFFIFCPLDGLTKLSTNEKTLKMGVINSISNEHPLTMTGIFNHYLAGFFHRTLVRVNKRGDLIPSLAIRIPRKEKNDISFPKQKKERHVRWVLKEGAKWSDGVPITGHDFLFSWKVGMHPKVPTGYTINLLSNIKNIVVNPKNNREFTVIFSAEYADYLKMNMFYVVPRHIEEEIAKKYLDKGTYIKNSHYIQSPQTQGLYSGPFMVEKLEHGHFLILKRNQYFYEKVQLNNITFATIPQAKTFLPHLIKKSVNIIPILQLSHKNIFHFKDKIKELRLPFDVKLGKSPRFNFISMNLENRYLKNNLFRKALLLGLNRDKLIKGLLGGHYEKSHHWVSQSDPYYSFLGQELKNLKTNKRKAIKILKQLKYQYNAEKKLFYDEGKVIQLTLESASSNRELLNFIQQEWKEIGLQIEIKTYAPKTYFGILSKGKLKGLGVQGISLDYKQNMTFMFHSKNIAGIKKQSGYNISKWNNKKIDELLNQFEKTSHEQKRKTITAKMLKIYLEETPQIPLYFDLYSSIIPRNLMNYVPHKSNSHFSEKWHFTYFQ